MAPRGPSLAEARDISVALQGPGGGPQGPQFRNAPDISRAQLDPWRDPIGSLGQPRDIWGTRVQAPDKSHQFAKPQEYFQDVVRFFRSLEGSQKEYGTVKGHFWDTGRSFRPCDPDKNLQFSFSNKILSVLVICLGLPFAEGSLYQRVQIQIKKGSSVKK